MEERRAGMMPTSEERWQRLKSIIETHIRPKVQLIDSEAHYPLDYMKALGTGGYYPGSGLTEAETIISGMRLVEETSKTCMTTGFNIWCHLAAMTYLRHGESDYLRSEMLPRLESGEVLGGTGLSNPMKFYAEMDKLYLRAERTPGETQDTRPSGYSISGRLPYVSNLGADHWFATIADCGDGKRVMTFVPCQSRGLTMTERIGFLGLNGSATYACVFDSVNVPGEWVISEEADAFIPKVRGTFILYQIPLGLGVTSSAIRLMRQAQDLQGGCNRYLPEQPDQLEQELQQLRNSAYRLAAQGPAADWRELVRVRLAAVYLTLRAVQACMLHQGSAGYTQNSAPSRRLREAYFFANLTPTVRHLEKLSANLT
jgi:hypothetical protein